ncbi:methyltransferase FkbM family protein [Haloferula helveola]|uniref:Methyltransferase FkbM family protein n=1 Tax=Haloferula helveola TaxID=490095 RepID=A0ABM7RG63_9BACT|nr:methyltransferase FkbM family protein [Haloferula helveola]
MSTAPAQSVPPGFASLALARGVVGFYRLWHGTLGLRGAGRLINHLSPRLSGLQCYPLRLPNGHIAEVDFRELSAFGWLNTMLGDDNQETPLIEAIAAHLSGDSVFWDIGANAGILSAEIARRTAIGEHHYFEPNPRIYPWAEAALSHLPQARGHPVAVSSSEGTATLFIPVNLSAFGSLEGNCRGEAIRVEVETVSGDLLVYERGLAPPSVIKIDTEGHEVEVMGGMRRLVAEYRPLVFFEHIELSDEQVRAMTPEGYRVGTLCDTTGAILDRLDRSAGHNSALVPTER